MKSKILLKEHKIYNWEKIDNVRYRCGFLNIDFSKVGGEVSDDKEIAGIVKNINGNFSFIREDNDSVIICSDRFQSFPLLYCIKDETIYVSDSLELLESEIELSVNPMCLNEFLAMGVVTGCETLFKDVFVVEAGQIVRIDKSSGYIAKIDYYLHKHTNDYHKPYQELKDELDERLHNVFNRVKDRLGSRMVVVPLSGGYDSRLVVEMLKKTGVTNVLCVSYGNNQDLEVNVAKRLANELGFKWIYVQQSGEKVEQLADDPKFWPTMKEISAASAMPYIQNYVIKELIADGTIPDNAVIMTGNSGDVVEGDQMPEVFSDSEKGYTREQLLHQILNKHYRLAGRKGASIPEVHEKIITRYLSKSDYSYDDVHDVYENFNWRERQSQFLFNDGQFYSEYCGVEWYFPLWDDEFVEFWQHLPTHLRYKRNFYYQYVNKEQIYSSNDITFRTKLLRFAKKYFYRILTKMYINKRIHEYDNGDSLWHLLKRKDFVNMIKWTKGVGTNSDTAKIWGLLINCFDINPVEVDFSKYKDFDIK